MTPARRKIPNLLYEFVEKIGATALASRATGRQDRCAPAVLDDRHYDVVSILPM